MKVKCIDDLVDGVTKGKEYKVTNLFIRNDINLYGIVDNYGVYNEFRADRFIIVEKDKLEVLTEWQGVEISIKLY